MRKGLVYIWLLIPFLLGNGMVALGQQNDSLPLQKQGQAIHNPAKASLYSALLPGLGQAYNRKYWKMPVIYAGFGTLAYFVSSNHKEYIRFKNAYGAITDDDPLTVDEFNGTRSADELLFYKDQYRRWRDLSIIISVGLYALNIIDANVDAHFFDYSISPDLSLHLQPHCLPVGLKAPAPGFKLSLSF